MYCVGNNANTIHYIESLGGVEPGDLLLMDVRTREVVFMERPLEPNMGPSLADVLLCTFESTNAGFSSFPLRKLLSRDGIQERTLSVGFLGIISRVLRLEVSTLVVCLSTRCYSRTNLRFLH